MSEGNELNYVVGQNSLHNINAPLQKHQKRVINSIEGENDEVFGKRIIRKSYSWKCCIYAILCSGYNDVSWHNSFVHMPNLQDLAEKGVILEQAYAQTVCTPSRAALLTGYYPYHIGMQV